MSTTNEIWIAGERLDLDEQVTLLPTFQANDRTKPDSIQADYSPEFSVPATAKNQQLLKHAAASQSVVGKAYQRSPCVLTSAGTETLPLGLLYPKGYSEGRYNLQLAGGNRRLIEALKRADGSDKKLSDLDLNRFNHYWTPENVLAKLSYDYWQANGWGYEVYERGKPVDFQAISPFDLYPSCSGDLVFQQILADAGFTADSLLAEPLAAALNVPSANPFTFSQDYRDARHLQSGFVYDPAGPNGDYIHPGLYHDSEFAAEKLNFSYTQQKPYGAPTAGASYGTGTYQADTLGYYDLVGKVPLFFACRNDRPGEISCKVILYINGQPVLDDQGNEIGKVEKRGAHFQETFAPEMKRYLLKPGDRVELYWQGDEWPSAGLGPYDQNWAIGQYGTQAPLPGGLMLASESQLSVTLLPEFPEGGLVKLQDWLPDMKQLDFVKAYMLTLGLTIQVDQYEPHLRLAPGSKLLQNISKAKNWTGKRDAYATPGRQPERNLQFRFGSFGQKNTLAWEEDENVLEGYGDGTILINDEVLPAEYELAKLAFAATEDSPVVAGLLRILNFKAQDLTTVPAVYNAVEAKPRLVLRQADGARAGKLVMVRANPDKGIAQVLADFTTTPSYFAGAILSLLLDDTCLTVYWADLRAMLDESRYLTERYRLTPRDIAELDFSVPIWDGILGDYFTVSVVSEYDPRRSVEVKLCRLNAAHLGAPVVPGEGVEFWRGEFYSGEFY